MRIAIVDLGIGNLRSVEQALKVAAHKNDICVTHDAAVIDAADKVVLPGQGAVGTWFKALQERRLTGAISRALKEKPLLGICVGMQALFRFCEEGGGVEGLGLFDGSVRHFKNFHMPATASAQKLKIPQMGWNQLQQSNEHPLWYNIADNSYFYFVHSYCANLDNTSQQDCVYGTADYGHEFIAAVGRDNVFAVQFHPEKSHRDGLQLLKNFSDWQA